MPHPNPAIEQIARALEDQPALLARFLPGFDDASRVAQAPHLPNHVIRTLGHLALYLHRAAERVQGLDPGPLPETDFISRDGRAGDPRRFDTESVCFGSTPVPEPSIYPTLARGEHILAAAAARIAAAVRDTGDELFRREVVWGAARVPTTAAGLAMRMIHHVGQHSGQIADLRRALGMPRVIG